MPQGLDWAVLVIIDAGKNSGQADEWPQFIDRPMGGHFSGLRSRPI
jgi:hypothetical protein